MERKQALAEGYEQLQAVYGQQNWTAHRMRALTDILDDYGPDPEHIARAIGAHIGDTDELPDGRRKGALPPAPADLLSWIEEYEQDEARQVTLDEEETRTQQLRDWEEQDLVNHRRPLPLRTLGAAATTFFNAKGHRPKKEGVLAAIFIEGDNLMVPDLKSWRRPCKECNDGWATVWMDPKATERAWLGWEYSTLSDEVQMRLKAVTVICDSCEAGREKQIKHRSALLGTETTPQVLSTLKKVRQLAKAREEYDAQQIGLEL